MAVPPTISLFHSARNAISLEEPAPRCAERWALQAPPHLPSDWVWPVVHIRFLCVIGGKVMLKGYSLQTSTPGPSPTLHYGGQQWDLWAGPGPEWERAPCSPLDMDRNWCLFWHKSAPLPCLLRRAGSWNRLFTGWSSMWSNFRTWKHAWTSTCDWLPIPFTLYNSLVPAKQRDDPFTSSCSSKTCLVSSP